MDSKIKLCDILFHCIIHQPHHKVCMKVKTYSPLITDTRVQIRLFLTSYLDSAWKVG